MANPFIPNLKNILARNRTRAERRAAKQATAIVVATTDASRQNIRSALGLQLFRLWMYDTKDVLTKLQADRKRIDCEALTMRDGDYTRLY